MNNIGGIIRCEICPIENVATFSNSKTRVTITPKDGEELWTELPINRKNTICVATPESSDAGTSYQHSCNTLLPTSLVNVSLLEILRKCVKCGCLIRYTDANAQTRILGTKDFPLLGTLEESPGSEAPDLAGYQLQLSSSSLTPALEYIEV